MQFMEFWLSVISGFSLTKNFASRDVDALRRKVHQQFIEQDIDIENMLSKESPEKRAIEYFKMSNAFTSLVTTGEPARPIPRVVRMIDTETSLGAQTERVLARQIGSRVMDIDVVKSAGPEDLITVNRVLATDMQRLISFGATIFDTQQKRVRLILLDAA